MSNEVHFNLLFWIVYIIWSATHMWEGGIHRRLVDCRMRPQANGAPAPEHGRHC